MAQFDDEREQELRELLNEVRTMRKEIAGLKPQFELPPDYAVLVRTPAELPPDYAVAVRPAVNRVSYEVLVRPVIPQEEAPVE